MLELLVHFDHIGMQFFKNQMKESISINMKIGTIPKSTIPKVSK